MITGNVIDTAYSDNILYWIEIFISAPGNVVDHVVIERQTESTIVFGEGARDSYLGYVTLKVSNSSSCCCQPTPPCLLGGVRFCCFMGVCR